MTAPDPLALAEEAERLANAATPGPWVRASNAEEVILSRALPEWEDDGTVAYETVATIADWGLTNWDADATFIARARELVPALAVALRAAHEENKRLVTQAAELGKWRDAVLNAAVVDWTYRKEHETDPVRAVNDLVCYALDVERDALRKENQRLRVANKCLEADLAFANAALTRYGEHKAHCKAGLYGNRVECSCGFAALAGGKGEG